MLYCSERQLVCCAESGEYEGSMLREHVCTPSPPVVAATDQHRGLLSSSKSSRAAASMAAVLSSSMVLGSFAGESDVDETRVGCCALEFGAEPTAQRRGSDLAPLPCWVVWRCRQTLVGNPDRPPGPRERRAGATPLLCLLSYLAPTSRDSQGTHVSGIL